MLNFKDYVEFADKERAHRREHRLPGIYGFFINDVCVYVGKSKCLHSRFKSHAEYFSKARLPKQEQYRKYQLLKPYIDKVEWRVLEETQDIDQAEMYWIEYYDNPIFNINIRGARQHFKGDDWDIAMWVNGEISYMDLKERTVKK